LTRKQESDPNFKKGRVIQEPFLRQEKIKVKTVPVVSSR
jgi:hypothetical protein